MFYCFLADGFEEVEALTPVDLMKRAGIEILTVGVTGSTITGAHGIKIIPDCTVEDISVSEEISGIILPGGMPGTKNLEKSEKVQSFIDKALNEDKFICAICAAPSILGHKGILKGKEAIAYPGFEDDLAGAKISEKYVVRDGKIITAKGAGVALDFGLEIISAVKDKAIAEKIRASIQCK